MGSCKQLLPLGDRPVVARCLDTLATGGAGEIVVVVPAGGNGVTEAVREYPARFVSNPEAEGDMASSVRAGRDALMSGVSGVIVHLCDYPLVSADTIERLIAEHTPSPDSIIIPCHAGRRGHPLLFPRAVLNELDAGRILRDLVQKEPGRVLCLQVDDPGVLIDMDTPEDYHEVCEIWNSCSL